MNLPNCVMCSDKKRKRGSIYCEDCQVYSGYEQEIWYKEALAMQQKQYRIDKREGFPLFIDHEADMNGNPVVAPRLLRAVGRPRIHDDVRMQVIEMFLHSPKISMRTIEKQMAEKGIKVSRETIRMYLKPIRKLI